MNRFGGLDPETSRGVRRQLGLTESQLTDLVVQAEGFGLLHEAGAGTYRVTSRGRELGLEMRDAVEETRDRARTSYRSYESYVPTTWEPARGNIGPD